MSCMNKRNHLKRLRPNFRKPSNYPTDSAGIPLRITRLFPMKLKDVTIESLNQSKITKGDVVCIQEMMNLFECFELHDFDRGPCLEKIKTLENCYSSFLKEKIELNKASLESKKKGKS